MEKTDFVTHSRIVISPRETCSITASLGTWSSCCRTHRREMAQSKPIMPMAKGKKNSRALQFETAKFNQDLKYLKVFGIYRVKLLFLHLIQCRAR